VPWSGELSFPTFAHAKLIDSSPAIGLLHRLPRHNDSDADSLAMSLKLNSGIMKCRADCIHAFGCRRELVVLKIADRFERQAGRFAQLVLSPAQKCAGGYGLFDSERLHIGTIADFRGGLSFNTRSLRASCRIFSKMRRPELNSYYLL
jgi:hypothetical protein